MLGGVQDWWRRRTGRTDGKSADDHIADGRRAEEAGRWQEACAHYRRAIAASPDYAPAHLNLGIALDAMGEAAAAEASFSAALEHDPGDAYAHYNLARLRHARADSVSAESHLRAALAARRDFPEAQVLLAHVLESRGELDAAAAALEAALRHRPGYAGALRNYGLLLGRLGRWAEAAEALQRAIAAAPEDADAQYSLGNACMRLDRPEEALRAYRQATALRPGFAEAWCNLGNVLADRGSHEEAARCLEKAIALKPDHADAHVGMGNVLARARQLERAADCFRRALAIDPGIAVAQLNLGNALIDQGLRAEALECLRAAVALRPGSPEARWALAMAHVPGLRATEDELGRLRGEIGAAFDDLVAWFDAHRGPEAYRAVGVAQPFWLAYQEENNRPLLERYGKLCARLMGEWQARRGLQPAARRAPGPIRVGVVSQFFRDHSVWNALMRGWFERLDAQRFALGAFCLDPQEDAETRFARARAARFEQGHIGLDRWAEVILDAQPDVLIYPEIGMDPMTVKLASLRLARVQVASWGHPETSGLPSIDAYLSAALLEPDNAAEHYSERLVALPNLGCHVHPRKHEAVAPDVAAWGIDAGAPLLVCPGTPFKYAPEHDAVFTAIARRLPEGRLVFFRYHTPALSRALEARLRAAFAREGLEFDRHAIFVPWQDKGPFLGLLGHARVFLDTIGFSGFNTALQAVQCGLPIVARDGRFLRGRLASGILRRLGLHELAATSDEAYVGLAVRLVRDAEFHASVRQRMAAQQHLLYADDAPILALEEFLAGVAA
jgi:predicted O-linked N-acetylglucosamine transferase (SPINDLY family)